MINKIFDKLFLFKQKSALSKEKKRLEKELQQTEKFPQYGDTEEENAMEVEDFETYRGLSRDARKLFKQVNKALKAIDKGTYGICEVCHNPIERGRLSAFPSVSTCVECSAKQKR